MADQSSSPDLGKRFLEGLLVQRYKDGKPAIFDTAALSGLRNIKASKGQVTCTMLITPEVQNRFGTMHGGCIATIVDTVGSAAIATQSIKTGVSLSISIDYFAPMPGMKECKILAQVVKLGKTIATCSVEIRHMDTNELVASGRHIKFLSNKPEQFVTHKHPQLPKARL